MGHRWVAATAWIIFHRQETLVTPLVATAMWLHRSKSVKFIYAYPLTFYAGIGDPIGISQRCLALRECLGATI